MYNSMYDGIVTNAIFLTLGILLSLLMAYRSGLIKPSENFKLGVAAATGGIAIVYLINFVMGFFGSGMGIMNINNSSIMSIGFSLVVIVIASLNLVLDFDFRNRSCWRRGCPRVCRQYWHQSFVRQVLLGKYRIIYQQFVIYLDRIFHSLYGLL